MPCHRRVPSPAPVATRADRAASTSVSLGRAAWQELIDRLLEQKRRPARYRDDEPDTRPNPGATEAQLRAADTLGDVLSAEEIRDGSRWREMLVRKQIDEDWEYDAALLNSRIAGLPEPAPPAPIAERIGYIPAAPFAISHTRPYGVDVRDGYVRELLTDATVASGPHTTSVGTVRTHLLHACRELWWSLGHPKLPPGRRG